MLHRSIRTIVGKSLVNARASLVDGIGSRFTLGLVVARGFNSCFAFCIDLDICEPLF